MIHPIIDESPLDFAQWELFEQERRSVMQPPLAEDESVLQHQAVEPAPCPRCDSSREVLHQPWSEDEQSHWRRAPR